jgi:hypothetical protein
MNIDAQIRINIPHKINGHDSCNVNEQMGQVCLSVQLLYVFQCIMYYKIP